MLETQSLSYAYDRASELHFPDISCRAGEHWLLLGPSGSGKTTLLHLLAGLRAPQEGSVTIDGAAIHQLSASALDRFRGKHVGMVFQEPPFIRSLTVEENLALAQRLAGVQVDPARTRSLLAQLNLAPKSRTKPDRLSVGERQRAAIARAIINRPGLILADEPTSALDDANADQVLRLLREQAAAVNAVLLIVTHDHRLKSHIDKQIHL